MKSFPGKNHNGFRRSFKASIAATMSLIALSGMGGVATAQSAAPSGLQSSASALVNKGEPMRTPAPFAGSPVDSGLKIGAVPAKAGALMNTVPLDPAVGLTAAGQQFRFSYSTTNQHGAVSPSTGAVFFPKGKAPAGGWPVLAWAHGTVGLADQCTPSMNPRSQRDQDYLNHWLNQGYAIVASDYAGMGTEGLMSYLNGKSTAANVVDSVIAAQDLPAVKQGGQKLSRNWAVIGQSQGGGAALHVALRATKRSQQANLNFLGTVATGAPAYVEEIVLAGSPTFPPVPLPAGLNTYAMYIVAAFREANPNVDVDSALTDEGKRMVKAAEDSCYPELSEALKGTNVARAFSKPLREVPGLEPALREFMQTPATGYDKPVFLGHGLKDMDVPTPIGIILNTDMWINQFIGDMRSRNQRVEVHWYPTDHGGTVPASQVHSTPFLAELFRNA
ncbi:alpha/beta hydrolase [Corynebacterium jeikeium]|uniref:alpha/beta hydrolase n=1 Tax=Corynebacterium jeikeium TaxID=38289 RepID=UPI00068B3E3D|nr:alpha/beta hydrolase [Corynebacterium jeikeium]